MNEHIDIWLVGNTGLRNPNRIQDGFKALFKMKKVRMLLAAMLASGG